MLHILTLHLSDKWVDIQKRELARFISEPYKVYARLGEEPFKFKENEKGERIKYSDTTISYDKHKHKFDGAISGAQHWTYSMGKLIDYVLDNLDNLSLIRETSFDMILTKYGWDRIGSLTRLSYDNIL